MAYRLAHAIATMAAKARQKKWALRREGEEQTFLTGSYFLLEVFFSFFLHLHFYHDDFFNGCVIEFSLQSFRDGSVVFQSYGVQIRTNELVGWMHGWLFE